MNAIKLILILFFLPLNSQSQVKPNAYFVINNDSPIYLVKTNKDKQKISRFIFYDRKEYEKNKKNKGKIVGFKSVEIPKTSYFNVIKMEEKLLEKGELNNLKLVDYGWIIKNGWKGRNNPNILLNNLYFLIEIKNKKFVKYKVSRTVVAH